MYSNKIWFQYFHLIIFKIMIYLNYLLYLYLQRFTNLKLDLYCEFRKETFSKYLFVSFVWEVLNMCVIPVCIHHTHTRTTSWAFILKRFQLKKFTNMELQVWKINGKISHVFCELKNVTKFSDLWKLFITFVVMNVMNV